VNDESARRGDKKLGGGGRKTSEGVLREGNKEVSGGEA